MSSYNLHRHPISCPIPNKDKMKIKVAGLLCKLDFKTNLLTLPTWKFSHLHSVWISDIPLSNEKKAEKTQQNT